MIYFLQPFEPKVEAPGPSLKGQKVVILAHQSGETLAEFPDLTDDLPKALGARIAAGVKKVEVVPHSKVKLWAEAHPDFTDPSDAGLDFDADAVVFLEVERFQIENPLSPGLFQGEARVHVKLYKITTPTDERGKPLPGRDKEIIVAHDEYVETAFPRTQGALPISSTVNRSNFRRKFFEIVVEEVSWQFLDHPATEMVQDTNL